MDNVTRIPVLEKQREQKVTIARRVKEGGGHDCATSTATNYAMDCVERLLATAAEHGGAAAGPLSEADAAVLQQFMALINSRLAVVAAAGATPQPRPAAAGRAPAARMFDRDSLSQHL